MEVRTRACRSSPSPSLGVRYPLGSMAHSSHVCPSSVGAATVLCVARAPFVCPGVPQRTVHQLLFCSALSVRRPVQVRTPAAARGRAGRIPRGRGHAPADQLSAAEPTAPGAAPARGRPSALELSALARPGRAAQQQADPGQGSGPSSQNPFASRSARRALLTPQVNPGSRYRGSRST